MRASFHRQAGQDILFPVLAITASAALYALAFPPFGWAAFSWVCLTPLIPVWEGQRPTRAALFGLAHGTLISLTTTPWLVLTIRDYFGRSLPFAAVMLVVFGIATLGIYHGATFAALALTRRAMRRALWLVLVPAAWTATEFARTSLGLRCPWEKLGDAHWNALRLRQLASLVGVYGITTLVAVGNVVAAESLRVVARWGRRERVSWAAPLAWCCAFGALLAAALAYGEVRLASLSAREASPSPSEPALDVLLVQGNLPTSLRWNRVHARRVLFRYGSLTRDALHSGPPPDLVVWPEQALQTAVDDPVYGPPLAQFLETLPAPILLGAPRVGGRSQTPGVYNSAYLFRPGRATLWYDKIRLVPFSETHPFGRRLTPRRGDLDVDAYRAGREPGLFNWGGPRLGVLICFEATYPSMARDLVRGGARVLVNLSNDGWFLGRGGQEQHLGQVIFRAVETGLPIVRATTTGISAIITPDGRLQAKLGRNRGGTLRSQILPGPGDPTWYARRGDGMAWSSIAGVVLAVAGSLWARVRGSDRAGIRAAQSFCGR